MTITPQRRHLAALAAGAAAFALSLFTLAPSVDFIDAGELATAAYTFGIAHPTGYPLFTMLAGLWSHLPFGEPILLLNILSAVLAAIGTGALVHLLWFLLGLADSRRVPAAAKGRQKNGAALKRPQPLADEARLGLAWFGALFTAFSETWWKTSLSIEVYALHLPLLVIILWLFATALFDAALDERRRSRRFLLFAFVLGLSFSNHMTTVYLAVSLLVTYFWKEGWGASSWKRIAIAVPAFAAGLLPYLYLPLRAASDPVLNWGNPVSLERILWHVSGKQYSVWIFASADAAKRQFSYFLTSFPSEFAFVGVPLAIIGAVFALIRHRRTGVMLLLLFASCVGWAINYDIHDIDSYFLLAYLVSGMWCAFGLWALLRWFGQTKPAVVFGAAALLVGLSGGLHFGRVSERDNTLVEDYTMNMFRSLKPNALVLSYQWDYWVSASLYYQHVKKMRPDLTIIDKELLRRSWYFLQLKRGAPELYRRCESEIRLFLVELDKFEHGTPYDPAVIEKRFNDMIAAFVSRSIDTRPVYMTIEMEKHLAPGYERVPEGLAFRLYAPDAPPSADAPVWDAFEYRPYAHSDRLIDNMINIYAAMLINRGAWLNGMERYSDAARYFDRALGFQPGNQQALQWRERNAAAMQMSMR
ncbi:MAG: DUF2723 domain-containing protein [Ignavibacteria bacterium]|nr:DUF2723 domain-containing protein [Ignavibacteria bacterium]